MQEKKFFLKNKTYFYFKRFYQVENILVQNVLQLYSKNNFNEKYNDQTFLL